MGSVEREVDVATRQWREMFAERCRAEWEHNRLLLEEIRGLVRQQNSNVADNARKIQSNAIAIAGLKTWTALIGGAVGVVGLAAALLQALR